jgi:hypothetical protein
LASSEHPTDPVDEPIHAGEARTVRVAFQYGDGSALEERRSEKYRHALITSGQHRCSGKSAGRDRCLALVPPGISRMNMSAVIQLVTCRNSR